MSEEVRVQRLTMAMRAIAFVFVVPFLLFFILVVLDSSLVAEDAVLAKLLRWEPYNEAYEGMIVTIFVVWGIMLWIASKSPAEHKLFIDFTIWANLAHGAFMLVYAITTDGELTHMVGDVALLLLIAVVLFWLRPTAVSQVR